MSESKRETESEDLTSLKWANPELYRQLGDVPLPSFCLVEGENDSGKSVIVQQLVWDALQRGLRVTYVTSECASRVLLNQFESLSFFVIPYFISNKFKILELHTKDLRWNEGVAAHLLNFLSHYIKNVKTEILVIDSISHIIAEAEEKDILNFFTHCRNLTGSLNKTIFVSIHPFMVEKELLTRIRSIVDGHIIVSIIEHRGRIIRTINIYKMRGAAKTQERRVAFEVEPAKGIKPLPFSSAKA
ncbi:MAG: ATPase domain-containing protein [Nitrososphaerales archaeon]